MGPFRKILTAVIIGLGLNMTTPLLMSVFPGQEIGLYGAAMAQSREERKVQSILKKAESLSGKIAKHESGERKFNDRTIASLAKQVLRLQDQIGEYESVDGFDEAVKLIADLSSRLEGLEDQLAAALEATGGLSERDFERQVKNTERLIQQAERLIKDADGLNWDNVTDARRAERIEKTLAQIEENAAEIIELVPLHAEMMEKIEAARVAVADVRTRTDTLLTARDGLKDRLAGYFQSGKATQDSVFVYDLRSWSYEVARMKDQQTNQLIFWNGMDETELYKSWAETLEADRARLEQIKQDYAGMSRRLLSDVIDDVESTQGNGSNNTDHTGGLDIVADGHLGDIETAFDLVQDLRDNAVERTRQRIATAQAEMARLEAELNYRDLVVGNTVNNAMDYGDAILVVLEGFSGDASDIKSSVQSDMTAARTELATTTRRVYDGIVANNDVPQHRYTGADADALIAQGNALFADVFKGAKQGVGAFIPDEDWYRDVGERAVGNTLEKYDESRLLVTVFATEPNNRLSKWTLMVTKNHIQGDRISFDVLERSYDEPISPYRVYGKDSITGLR